ncbi:FAD-dependent monooxygenase [Permianibacter sp. IMCC34836]|nr:FAD-dependent monooxygenase [Permianibacter fluminis]
MKPQHITLIGAGLVGSLLAVYLARRGYDVTIIEKRPDMRTAAISAGRSINLALANRGIRPLEELGLMQQVRDIIIPMKGRMLHDEQGQTQLVPYGQQPHEVIYSVSRGELNKLLMTAAEATGKVKIVFETGIEQIDFNQQRILLKHEQTGAQQPHHFELLIGADGGGSVVRKAIDALHGKASIEEKLFHSYKELNIAAGANGSFRIEKEALHIWPRGDFMMIGLPNNDGSFTMTLFAPDQGAVSFAALHDHASFTRFFEQNFADALKLMPDAAETYFRNPTGFLGTVHCPNWYVQNKALLIGDAAHAIVPFHGQGMNCGFEDCFDLNRLLDEHHDNWQPVFAAYAAARKPNGEAIALMAQENYVEMRATVRDPKFQLKKTVGFELEKRWPQLFSPRYSMVMFQHIPYAEALRRGRINDDILAALCDPIEQAEQVDYILAEQLIRQKLG